MCAQRRQTWPRPMQAGFWFFGRKRARRIVRPHGVDRAFPQSIPEGRLMFRRAHRRDHLGQKTVWVTTVDAEIRRRCFYGETHACAASGANDLKPVPAGQMDDIKVRSRNLREIKRGLNREGFCYCGMRLLPIGEVALGLAQLELVTCPVDQSAGLAMNARNRILPQRCDRAKAVQENVIAHRFHDTGDAGHVELEGANAELLRIAGNFFDLLLGEDLWVENRIDVAAIVHRVAECRQVLKIRVFQATKENSDRSDTAQNGRASLGLGFALEGALITDMNMRVENTRQDDSVDRVVGVGGG